MKNFIAFCGLLGCVCAGGDAVAVSAGTVSGNSGARGGMLVTNSATTGGRGMQGVANAYKQNQIANYYMLTQKDVGTACSERIMKCLNDFCDGMTVSAGIVQGNKCASVTNTDLYNYALL